VTFALRSADALSGTLNLRRTVARVAELAMTRYGAWAGVTLVDGIQLRRSDTAGADDLGEQRRPMTTRELSEEAAAVLTAAVVQPMSYSAPVPAAVLSALGVPAGSAERLERPGALLVTVPLTSAVGGRAVLAVLADRRPDLDELADLARRASRAMTTAAVYEEQSTLARTLRDALVPAPLPSIPGVQFGASYRPAQEASQIGGDFYDITPRPDGQWAVSIGDVCGKGIGAAVLTGQVRQSLRTASLVTDDPAEALRIVNETLLRSDGTTFVTAMFGVLSVDRSDVRIRLATGGHPPPLLLRAGQVTPVPVRGTLVGMLADARFQTVDLPLQTDDVLVFYTDGVPEARGATGLLGLDPVVATLADCADLTAQAIGERLVQLVLEHVGDWPHDDVALLVLRALPVA
jgi:serine phosphatase RsbU (regulator of sigma subunit)